MNYGWQRTPDLRAVTTSLTDYFTGRWAQQKAATAALMAAVLFTFIFLISFILLMALDCLSMPFVNTGIQTKYVILVHLIMIVLWCRRVINNILTKLHAHRNQLNCLAYCFMTYCLYLWHIWIHNSPPVYKKAVWNDKYRHQSVLMECLGQLCLVEFSSTKIQRF